MKIILLTELRGAHADLYILLKETVADIYLIGGSLLGTPFADENSGKTQDASPDISRNAVSQKYSVLANILSTKPYAAYRIIPGCGDIDFTGTPLEEYLLHGSVYAHRSLTIAGQGCLEALCSESRADDQPFCFSLDPIRENLKSADKPDILVFHPSPEIGSDREKLNETAGELSESLIFNCRAEVETGIVCYNGRVVINPRPFGTDGLDPAVFPEGGYFYECGFDGKQLEKIVLRKLYGERIYDIAEYIPENGEIVSEIIDRPRYKAMIEGKAYDNLIGDHKHIAEIRLFRDIRNFLRIHQTEETEKRVELLHKGIADLGQYSDKTALDLVGSANVGLAGEKSDIDTVIYLKAGTGLSENEEEKVFKNIESELKNNLKDNVKFDIIDRINLDRVRESIAAKDTECYETQLFSIYRAACRPVNYRILSPVEDLLRKDRVFQRTVENAMKSHLQMFATTTSYNKSFDKYLNRLKTSGVKIPDSLEKKINTMLQKGGV